MSVPYIFATALGGSGLPLSWIDADFAYITNGNPVFANLTIAGTLTVGGTTTLNGPTVFGNNTITIGGQTANPTGFTGTGLFVLNNTPTLISPLLGTPTSGNLANCNNLPISTGVSGLGANVATFLAVPSSANLAAAVTGETGTGQLVFNTNPTINTPTINSATLTSPALGTPVSGTLTNCTGFPSGNLSGLVPLALGGTGASTQPSALNNLCPPQSAPQAGFVLTTDGAGNITWNYNPGGTITSITLDGSTTGLTINSAPSATITTSGTFTLGGVLAPSNGGTGISALGAGVQASLGAAVDTVGGFATFPAGSFPAGAVVYFAMPTAPAGWLFCDGGSVSTTTYASLFAAIGYTYGGGGASFNLPNLNGQFIRSWDASGAVDPGRVFGSNQAQAYLNHSHTATSTDSGHAHGILNTGPNANGGGNGWLVNPQADTGLNTLTGQANITTTVNTSTTGGNETRPVNVALYACIKF